MTGDNPIEVIHDMLKMMVSRKASDLFICVGFPPAMKIDGQVTPISEHALTEAHTKTFARALMNDKQLAAFEETKECNFAVAPGGIGRFRASAYVDQNGVGLVLRTINTRIPTMEELGLPAILREVAMSERGLVMVVGGTGSGKSTSLAAMIGYRNEHSRGHIITIEDPVEFVHEHRHCIVTQREVGVTCESWDAALKNTLRQAPDVILIGEMRDRETMEHAIAFAETGHLCLATLHANSANQALDRIINFFPDDRRQQLLMDLSLNVRAFLSQRLVPREERQGARRRVRDHARLAADQGHDLQGRGEQDEGADDALGRSSACRPSTRRCSTCTRRTSSATRTRCASPIRTTTCT